MTTKVDAARGNLVRWSCDQDCSQTPELFTWNDESWKCAECTIPYCEDCTITQSGEICNICQQSPIRFDVSSDQERCELHCCASANTNNPEKCDTCGTVTGVTRNGEQCAIAYDSGETFGTCYEVCPSTFTARYELDPPECTEKCLSGQYADINDNFICKEFNRNVYADLN